MSMDNVRSVSISSACMRDECDAEFVLYNSIYRTKVGSCNE